MVKDNLTDDLQKSMSLAQEKGDSPWLTVLALQENGFSPNKSEFRDAICLRYKWRPQSPLDKCACGESFDVNHTLLCPT